MYTIQFRQRHEYWVNLLLAMSDGDMVGIKTLMETDLNEFYYIYRAYVDRVERINNPPTKRPAPRQRPASHTQPPEEL